MKARFRLEPFAGGDRFKCGRPECYRLADVLLVDAVEDLGVMPYCRRDGGLERDRRNQAVAA